MNLNSRPNVSEMSDQQIAYELKDFEWEYIALADWARSDAQYLAGEVYLNERKESLLREKELRAQGSQLTPYAADETWGCPMCDAVFPIFVLSCPCGYPRPSRR